jgi:cation diffusion facilitator CzcD-associated flavoprotein CzcO
MELGGTWSLFKYPGFRSDSDMFSFSFSFHPWSKEKRMAAGGDIHAYLEEVSSTYGIRENIRFGNGVAACAYDSTQSKWTLTLDDSSTLSSTYLIFSTGYYDYVNGYSPSFEGVNDFEGPVVHSQKWHDGIEYEGKNVVVIGSGATAITAVPAMARTARHVTMLQRSPSYIAPVRGAHQLSWVVLTLAAIFGSSFMTFWWKLVRWFYILEGIVQYWCCINFPGVARQYFLSMARRRVPKHLEHFNPKYNPWEQRVCACPDGDFYDSVSSRRSSVVTDHISHLTSSGIKLKSGRHLDADVIMLATGLNMQV